MSRTFQIDAGGIELTVAATYHRGPDGPYFEIDSVTCADDLTHVLSGPVLSSVEETLAEAAAQEQAERCADALAPEHA